MSGGTEDMTIDAKSVDSALIWTDNPELEYFRSMLSNRSEDRLASGLDVEDSLIGDSTVKEMLEIVHDDDSSSRRLGRIDTSGLSYADSNTVDNIFIGDESILDMKKTLNRVFDDGTLETPEDGELVLPMKNLPQEWGLEQKFNITNHQTGPRENSPAGRQRQCNPSPQFIPHDACDNVIKEVTKSTKIPGFIFVTDGHPSIIHTCPDQKYDKFSKYNGKGDLKKIKPTCRPSSLIICLTLLVIVTSTIVAVYVYRIKQESALTSSSSQRQNDGLPSLNPNILPTFEPSSLRATKRPQVVQVSTSKSDVYGLETRPEGTASAGTEFPSTKQPMLDSDSISNITPKPPPTFSPTELKFSTSMDIDTIKPTVIPTALIVSIPKDELISASTTAPTMKPTVLFVSPTAQTIMPTKSPEDLPNSITYSPTPSVTDLASGAFTTETTESCVSTITTDKTCYKNGDDIRIVFNNCEPKASDWIGIYPARQGVSNLRQPLSWVWTCGNQLCNDPVASGEATLFDASGSGSFRALLLRDNNNRGSGYVAYAMGNTFAVSSRCNQ